jgi:hypothetical protein
MASAHPPNGPLLPVATDEKVVPVASAQPPPSYQGTPPAEAAHPPSPADRRDRRRRCFRRFGHFLIAALLLWFAGRFIVRHCELRRFAPSHHDEFPSDLPPGRKPPGHGGHFPHPGERIDSCVDPGDWVEFDPSGGPHPPGFEGWQRVELSLPSSAENIFLISRGFHSGGIIHVVEGADRDDIGVEVTVGSSKSNDLLKRTKVCTLRRKEDGYGVGIFTPPFMGHRRDHDSLFFNITVTLPEGEDIATIPHFETHMPKYGHFIKGLEKHAFGSFSLHSSDGPIVVESLIADDITIRSRNSPIVGNFSTTSSIKLKTTNAPIHVNVKAFHRESHPATKVRMHTSNSILVADLALLSSSGGESNGNFIVHARTSNSPLAVNITEQAPESLLKLEAHTSNAPAHVHLHPSFEGVFKLRTSVFPPFVSPEENVEDPAGLGRKRVVNVKTVGHGSGIVCGDVAWVPREEEVDRGGMVEVVSRNAPLHLSL